MLGAIAGFTGFIWRIASFFKKERPPRRSLLAPDTASNDRPEAVSLVPGLELTVVRRQGVLLSATPVTALGPSHAAVEKDYYQIAVWPTGTNPEYPAATDPYLVFCTVGLGQRMGLREGALFCPAGSRYVRFRLVEEFNSGISRIGNKIPPHHVAMVEAHFQDAAGAERYMTVGHWVRKSERESGSWYTPPRTQLGLLR